MEGRGTIYYPSGNKYEGSIGDISKWSNTGEVKNNLKDGKGVMYFSNGDKYEGISLFLKKKILSIKGSGNLVKDMEKELLSSPMERNT